jgi:hypothetical protein
MFFFPGNYLKLKIIKPFLWLNFQKIRILLLRFGKFICNSSFARGFNFITSKFICLKKIAV